jgi:type 1 glutamine amidotransferase
VAGWGWPYGSEDLKGQPAAKVVVSYASGQTEEFILKNGVEIADYATRDNVPGSKATEGLVSRGQVRTFTRELSGKAAIQKITLESFNNGFAPVFVSITAETGEPSGKVADSSGNIVPGAAAKVPSPPANAEGPRVLLVGGGSSHDFGKWFDKADRATLAEIKPGWIDYTENVNAVNSALLANVDVLVWSANQPITDETGRALLTYANAGKAIVLSHPGIWYNWKNLTAWNKEIVGGGSRGHDRFGEFEVKVTDAQHPVMAGVPEQFKITDELYYFIPDTNGTPVQVLAQATSPRSGKTFPQVWIVKHPKARIVAITLGHDAKSHELPAYKTLLKNAVNWAAGK